MIPVRMNPFQLALLNISQRQLRERDGWREYGWMAIDGLLSHQYVEKKGDFLVITRIGRLALADIEADIDKK